MKYGMKGSSKGSSMKGEMGQASKPTKVEPYKCRDMGREKPLPMDKKGYPDQAFGYKY